MNVNKNIIQYIQHCCVYKLIKNNRKETKYIDYFTHVLKKIKTLKTINYIFYFVTLLFLLQKFIYLFILQSTQINIRLLM